MARAEAFQRWTIMEMMELSRHSLPARIRELQRAEILTKKLRKLPPGFYDAITKVMSEIAEDASNALENRDLESYLHLKEEMNTLEKGFRWFFQVRWEKIALYSMYDLNQEDMAVLSSYEKAALLEFKSVYDRFYGKITGGEQ